MLVLLGLCCYICAVVFVLLRLCCCVCAVGCLCCWVCAIGFVLLSLCCLVCAVGCLRCWVCAVIFVLFGVCAVGFVLLGLCCCVCAVGFVLLGLCCLVYSVVSRILSALHSRCCLFHCGFLIYTGFYTMVWFWIFSLREASLCPISPINSITCLLIFRDFGYISCFFLPYVHFSHHSFLNFLCRGLFLDIFTSWSSIMSNISHRLYLLFPDFPWFWIYFLLFSSLCPFFSSWTLSFPPTWLIFGHFHFLKLHYVQYLS